MDKKKFDKFCNKVDELYDKIDIKILYTNIIEDLCKLREEKMNSMSQDEIDLIQQCMDIVDERFKIGNKDE